MDPVAIYMRELTRCKFLKREEELVLIVRAQAGDRDAIEQIVKSQLRYAMKIAQRYCGQGVEFDDLIQAANEGLLHAITKFDPNRGFRFGTYATAWIRQRCSDAKRRAFRYNSRFVPLERDGETIADHRAGDESRARAAKADEAHRRVDELFTRLLPRHAEVMRMRMRGLTMEEISLRMGVTKQRIGQISRRAMADLGAA